MCELLRLLAVQHLQGHVHDPEVGHVTAWRPSWLHSQQAGDNARSGPGPAVAIDSTGASFQLPFVRETECLDAARFEVLPPSADLFFLI